MQSDPYFEWVLGRLAREHAADPHAPVHPVSHPEAIRIADHDLAWIHDLPEMAPEPETLLSRTDRVLAGHMANARTPRFMNQLFSGVHGEAMAGFLAGVFTNNTLSTRVVAPAATEIERAVVSWLLRLLPWDETTAGGSATPAGSFSNYLAVYLARKRSTARHGNDQIHRLAVFASAVGHYSVPKGADLAGIPPENVFRIPADNEDRLDPRAVAAAMDNAAAHGLIPFLVSATLGTTVAGVLDPVADLAQVANERGAWLHVDAAWGGFGLCGSEADRFRAGLEHADSVTWDAHKCSASPLALSFLLVRDREDLEALEPPGGGGYLFGDVEDDETADQETTDLGQRSLYCGKPFLSLGLWLLWKARGASGIRAHVDSAQALTRRFRDRIEASDRFELAAEPETSLVCFRPVSASVCDATARENLARRIRAKVVEDGRWLIRLCPFQGESVFRALFVNPLLTETLVDELADRLEASHLGAG